MRRKTFDTEVFRGKDTVISPGYESLDIKQLNKLLGNNDNYFKLESIIDEGLRYPVHNYYGYTEEMRRIALESAVARWNNK